MSCDCGKKKNNTCGMTPEVVEIINEECPVLFHKVTISADRGDDSPESPVAPTNGTYRNALVVYEATNHKYIYSSDGIYTRIDNDAKMFNELLGRPKYNGEEMTSETDIPSVEQLREDMERADEALGDRIDDTNASVAAEREARAAAIQAEATARDNADQSLSAQITELSGDIAEEAAARAEADLALSQDIIDEANTRSQNDTRIDAALAEEATTRGIEDATIRAEIEQEVQDRQDAIDDVQAELNQNYMNDLEMEANASSVTFIEDKINPVTGVTSQERDVIPTASATTAGTMSAAEFNSITDSQEKIEALLGGAVAITGLPASPTQAQLTTAWKTETGRDELINRASIYDVTNEKVWTYYTNVTTWEPVDAHGSVSVAQFTNGQLGTIKGSTLAGDVSANADGTGSVSGWSNLVNSVAGKASQNDMTQAQTDITNIQGSITTINTTLAGKANIADIPTKTSELTNDTNYVSDSNYVHTDNNFTTVEKTNVANNTAAVSSMQPKVTKLDDTAVRLVANKTIPDNANLNTLEYLAVGNYVCSTNTGAQSLSNCPVDQAFRMEVYNATSTTYNDETTGTWRYRWRKITTLSGTVWYQSANSGSTAGQWTYYDWIQAPRMTDLPTRTSQLTNDTDNSTAQASIYAIYVDCVNGDDSNNGTEAHPLKTLTAAFKQISSGKKHAFITFKSNGTYTLQPASGISTLVLEGCYVGFGIVSNAITDVTIDNSSTLRLENSSIEIQQPNALTVTFTREVRMYNSMMFATAQVVFNKNLWGIGSVIYANSPFSVLGGRCDLTNCLVHLAGGAFTNGSTTDGVFHLRNGVIDINGSSTNNLLRPSAKAGGDAGITASIDVSTGIISLSGTGSSQTWNNIFEDQVIALQPGTYTFSIDHSVSANIQINCTAYNGGTAVGTCNIPYGSTSATLTISGQASTNIRVWISSASGKDVSGVKFRMQLQTGSSATPWQSPWRGTYFIRDNTSNQSDSVKLINSRVGFLDDPKFSVSRAPQGKIVFLNQSIIQNYDQLLSSGLSENQIRDYNSQLDYTDTKVTAVLEGTQADDGSRTWDQVNAIKQYVDANGGGDVRIGDVLSQPNDVAYVDTQNLIDEAVTPAKVDFSKFAIVAPDTTVTSIGVNATAVMQTLTVHESGKYLVTAQVSGSSNQDQVYWLQIGIRKGDTVISDETIYTHAQLMTGQHIAVVDAVAGDTISSTMRAVSHSVSSIYANACVLVAQRIG